VTQTVFSPDYLWWWDGHRWVPAVSVDGLWRWDGHRWVSTVSVDGLWWWDGYRWLPAVRVDPLHQQAGGGGLSRSKRLLLEAGKIGTTAAVLVLATAAIAGVLGWISPLETLYAFLVVVGLWPRPASRQLALAFGFAAAGFAAWVLAPALPAGTAPTVEIVGAVGFASLFVISGGRYLLRGIAALGRSAVAGSAGQARPPLHLDLHAVTAATNKEEELASGAVVQALAIPLLPFVAVWEAWGALTRAVANASLLAAFEFGRVIGAISRALRRALRRAWVAFKQLMDFLLRPVRQLARLLKATAEAVFQLLARPLRALTRLVAQLLKRAVLVLRTVLRSLMLGVRAVFVRLSVPLRIVARAVASVLRRVWTLLRALARSFVLAMRAVAARLLVPLRIVARAVASVLRRAWTLLRALARSFVLAMRAVGARLLVPLRLVARGLLRLARVIRALWRPVRLALDLALDVVNFTGEVLLRLLRFLWQPVLLAVELSLDLLNATLWPIRLARRIVSQLVLTTKRLVIRMWTIAHLITAAALQPFGAALRYSARAVRLAAEYSIATVRGSASEARLLGRAVLRNALHGRIKAPSVRIPGDQAGSTSVQEPAQAVGAGHSADINA